MLQRSAVAAVCIGLICERAEGSGGTDRAGRQTDGLCRGTEQGPCAAELLAISRLGIPRHERSHWLLWLWQGITSFLFQFLFDALIFLTACWAMFLRIIRSLCAKQNVSA